MRKGLLAAACAAAFFVCAPASAAIMVATYSGVVATARDDFGIFGAAGAGEDLVGKQFTARFRYDTERGLVMNSPGTDYRMGCGMPVICSAGTGDDWHYVFSEHPILSATFFVNGHSRTMAQPYQLTDAVSSTAGNQTLHAVQTHLPEVGENTEIQYAAATGDLSQPFSHSYSGPLYPYANCNIGCGAYTLGRLSGQQGQLTSLAFSVTGLTISAAPEPAIWMVLLSGFGLTGSALRRSRRRAYGCTSSTLLSAPAP